MGRNPFGPPDPGAAISKTPNDGSHRTVLDDAVRAGDVKAARKIINDGFWNPRSRTGVASKPGWRHFQTALLTRNRAMGRMLATYGARPDTRELARLLYFYEGEDKSRENVTGFMKCCGMYLSKSDVAAARAVYDDLSLTELRETADAMRRLLPDSDAVRENLDRRLRQLMQRDVNELVAENRLQDAYDQFRLGDTPANSFDMRALLDTWIAHAENAASEDAGRAGSLFRELQGAGAFFEMDKAWLDKVMRHPDMLSALFGGAGVQPSAVDVETLLDRWAGTGKGTAAYDAWRDCMERVAAQCTLDDTAVDYLVERHGPEFTIDVLNAGVIPSVDADVFEKYVAAHDGSDGRTKRGKALKSLCDAIAPRVPGIDGDPNLLLRNGKFGLVSMLVKTGRIDPADIEIETLFRNAMTIPSDRVIPRLVHAVVNAEGGFNGYIDPNDYLDAYHPGIAALLLDEGVCAADDFELPRVVENCATVRDIPSYRKSNLALLEKIVAAGGGYGAEDIDIDALLENDIELAELLFDREVCQPWQYDAERLSRLCLEGADSALKDGRKAFLAKLADGGGDMSDIVPDDLLSAWNPDFARFLFDSGVCPAESFDAESILSFAHSTRDYASHRAKWTQLYRDLAEDGMETWDIDPDAYLESDIELSKLVFETESCDVRDFDMNLLAGLCANAGRDNALCNTRRNFFRALVDAGADATGIDPDDFVTTWNPDFARFLYESGACEAHRFDMAKIARCSHATKDYSSQRGKWNALFAELVEDGGDCWALDLDDYVEDDLELARLLFTTGACPADRYDMLAFAQLCEHASGSQFHADRRAFFRELVEAGADTARIDPDDFVTTWNPDYARFLYESGACRAAQYDLAKVAKCSHATKDYSSQRGKWDALFGELVENGGYTGNLDPDDYVEDDLELAELLFDTGACAAAQYDMTAFARLCENATHLQKTGGRRVFFTRLVDAGADTSRVDPDDFMSPWNPDFLHFLHDSGACPPDAFDLQKLAGFACSTASYSSHCAKHTGLLKKLVDAGAKTDELGPDPFVKDDIELARFLYDIGACAPTAYDMKALFDLCCAAAGQSGPAVKALFYELVEAGADTSTISPNDYLQTCNPDHAAMLLESGACSPQKFDTARVAAQIAKAAPYGRRQAGYGKLLLALVDAGASTRGIKADDVLSPDTLDVAKKLVDQGTLKPAGFSRAHVRAVMRNDGYAGNENRKAQYAAFLGTLEKAAADGAELGGEFRAAAGNDNAAERPQSAKTEPVVKQGKKKKKWGLF